MMNKTGIKYLALAAALIGLASCESENALEQADKAPFTFDASQNMLSDIVPFQENGAPTSRVNFAGNQFENGDLIKIRIVAPFTSSVEWGEYTDGVTHDNFWILKWTGKNLNTPGVGASWTNVPKDDYNFDLNNDYIPTTSNSIWTLSQNTPYVFTATTWTEEVHAQMSTPGKPGGNIYTWFNSVFKADQRKMKDYKSSDVLWAQQIMQTGTQNVRLSFQHKMSALCIDISDFASELDLTEAADEIILTLENMPDIDQQEVIIGNYYAGAIKSGYRPLYGDYYRTACSKEQNGTVLGISRINEASSTVEKVAIETLPQTATYTAYHDKGSKVCYLIIPPYTVPSGTKPTLWLRQGTKRWSAPLTLLENRTFVPSNRYHVAMKKPAPSPEVTE